MIFCRSHRSRSRFIIPGQQIHFSVFPGDVYTPQATLAYGVDIPTVPQKDPGPWTAELLDEKATMDLLTALLHDQQKTLKYLGDVLLLLYFSKLHPHSARRRHTSDCSNTLGIGNGQTMPMPTTQWSEISIREQSDFDKFALTVIYDVTCTHDLPQVY